MLSQFLMKLAFVQPNLNQVSQTFRSKHMYLFVLFIKIFIQLFMIFFEK